MLELRFERNQIYHQADGPAIHLYMRHRWHLRGLPPGPRIVHLADNMDEHAHGDTNAVRSVVYRAQDLYTERKTSVMFAGASSGYTPERYSMRALRA